MEISKNINLRFIFINFPNALNIAIPIILIPVVIAATGIVEFGRIIYYQGYISIALIISENGLNTIVLSAIKEDNSNQVVFHTILIKVLLAICLFGVMILLVPEDDIVLFSAMYFSVFGQALNVSYLYVFQKREGFYSFILLTTKFILLGVFFLLKIINILQYALFLGISEFLTGLFSLLLSGHFKGIICNKIDLPNLKILALRGLNFSSINLLSSGYSISIPIYLKIFSGLEITGIYGAIEKIYRGFCNVTAPFNLMLLGERNFVSVVDFFRMRQVRLFFAIFISVLVLVGFFDEILMFYILPSVNYKIFKYSFLLSLIIPIIVFFSRMFVINFFIKRSLEHKLIPIYFLVFAVSIPTHLTLIYFFGLIGSIFAVIISELICLYKLNNFYRINF